jgi:protein TonB
MKTTSFCVFDVILIISLTACGEEHISYPMPTYNSYPTPTYNGGYQNLARTIKLHLKYPGHRCYFSGDVYVSFIVEADGRISNKTVVKGISSSEGCNADEEALKVLDYLTEWQPAEKEGKKISVRVILPIKFSL